MVKAMNNDEVWNREPVLFVFTITPPFWDTWWFYTLTFSGLVVSVFGGVRYRLSRLERAKRVLEEQVKLKTHELREEKHKVEEQKKEIEKKNRDITASIHYAKRIQDAILPGRDDIHKLIPQAFILFRPRDIVSGDFYWFTQVDVKGEDGKAEQLVMIAAVDCTGHGVPGAFMSLVGYDLLSDIVDGHKVTDPALVLHKLHEGVVQTLKKEEKDSGTVDGMDISLCAINPNKRTLAFSSTGRPLFLIRDGEVSVIRNGRHPIGLVLKKERSYETQHLALQEGDTVYIFTDGYCDQLGGDEGEKLMYDRFRELLLSVQDKPLPEQETILASHLEKWRGEYPQLDDILVIGMRF
jgi:serine phosphatase RsbU (regulator of sigma subunit)